MFPSLDQALAGFEGFGTPGTIATRQNNPGNLIYGPFAQSMGASGSGTNNIAVFPNSDTGFAAMDQLIQHYAGQGYNLQQLIGAWAPGNAKGNTPQSQQNYTNFVANQTGLSPGQSILDVANKNSNNALATGGSILGGALGGLLSGGNPGAFAKGSVQGGAQGSTAQGILSTFSAWSFARVAAILTGLICIAGAIYLFKGGDVGGIIEKVAPAAA